MSPAQRDAILPDSVTAERITDYLLSKGWRLVPFKRDQLLVFEGPEDDSGEPIIEILPRSEDALDFAARAHDLIAALSVIEERPAGQILDDIVRRIRPRAVGPEDRVPKASPSGANPVEPAPDQEPQATAQVTPRKSLQDRARAILKALWEPFQVVLGRMAVSASRAYLRRHPELNDALSYSIFRAPAIRTRGGASNALPSRIDLVMQPGWHVDVDRQGDKVQIIITDSRNQTRPDPRQGNRVPESGERGPARSDSEEPG